MNIRAMIKSIISYPEMLWRWILKPEGKFSLFGTILLILTVIILCSNMVPRYVVLVGLVMQITGIGLTINGASRIIRSLRQWGSSFPIPRAVQVASDFAEGNVSLPGFSVRGTMDDNWVKAKDASHDARLTTLETNLKTLHDQVYPLAGLLSQERLKREQWLYKP